MTTTAATPAAVPAHEFDFFRDNGFLIVRQAVAGAQLAALVRELDDVCRAVESGLWRGNHLFEDKGSARVIFNPYDFSPALRDLVNRPDMVGRASAFLGGPIHLHHSKLMGKPAGLGTAQPPHQDYYYWQGKKANQVAVFVCVDPCTVANGCLRVIPGSHKAGLLEHHQEHHPNTHERHWVCAIPPQLAAGETPFIAQPGDALFFGSLTIHCSEGNNSAMSRRAVIFEYDELGNLPPAMGWGAPMPPVQWP